MTQDDKDLLLRDLCGRLPYGVKVSCYDLDEEILKCDTLEGVERSFVTVDGFQWEITDIKPYLFPLSSMTKEQKKFFDDKNIECDGWEIVSKEGSHYQSCYTDIEEWIEVIDWLNKNHFDHRGLIKKSLAIDATNLGIYK